MKTTSEYFRIFPNLKKRNMSKEIIHVKIYCFPKKYFGNKVEVENINEFKKQIILSLENLNNKHLHKLIHLINVFCKFFKIKQNKQYDFKIEIDCSYKDFNK